MSEEEKNDEILFSIKGNKVVKTVKGKYLLNIELNENNFNILMKKYYLQSNPAAIKHIDMSKNELMSKLTEKEIKMLKEISDGKTNLQLAGILNISIHTVKVYVTKIFRKMEVKDRLQAVKKAISENIIDI